MTPRALICCVLGLFVMACASLTELRGEYVIVELNGETISPNPPITVKIEEGWLYVHGPVNRAQATIARSTLGAFAVTRRAGPPALMELESAILAAFEGGALGTGDDGSLIVEQGGDVTLRMAPRLASSDGPDADEG